MRVNIPRALFVIVLLAVGGSWQLSSHAQGVTEAERLLQKAVLLETVDGDLPAAIDQYKKIVAENGGNRAVAARALLRLAGCYEKLGVAEAQKTYQQLINDYSDQTAEVTLARQKLAALATASQGQASGPSFRKITIPGEIASGARLSPDGARLAMGSGGDVWAVNLRGKVAPEIAGVPERLTHGANAASTGLTWSGNGQWIAYNEDTIPTRNIYVLPVSGGSPRKLTRPVPLLGGGSPWWIGLSSDGSRLAYTTVEAQNEKFLRIVSAITGELVMRLGNPAASEPRFSPDDTRLAYVRQWRGPTFPDGEVRVVRLIDGSDLPVTKTPALFHSLAWSPDGRLLAFLTHPNRNDYSVQEVWITPAMGTGEAAGEPTKIKLTRYAESIAGWGADNKIGLLFRSPSHNAIYTVPLSGGKATQVTPDGDTFLPQWSPDGKRIYFRPRDGIAFVPAVGGVISAVSQGGDKVTVTLPGGGNHISPDGQRIVFSGVKKGIPGVHLWTMPIAGGEPVQLTMTPDLDAWQPRWSPDGQWIAFESERQVSGDRKLDENIFIVSSKGGEPRQLTRHTDSFCELMAWSPGGDSVAYACSDEMIRIVPVGGGEPRAVLKVDGLQSHQGSLAWTIDGSRLLYTAKRKLWTVSNAGGEPTAIATDLDGNILQFALSPDGKTIAFNAPSGGDLELWLMEGFLPPVKGK